MIPKRQASNQAIVDLLASAVAEYPSLRFGQLLEVTDVVVRVAAGDTYVWRREVHIESDVLLKRVVKQSMYLAGLVAGGEEDSDG